MDSVITIEESLHPVFRQLFYIIASLCFVLGSVLGLTVAIGYTGAMLLRITVSGTMMIIIGILFPYTLLRTRFQLIISNNKVLAQIWPFRGVEVDIYKIISVQTIEIDPLCEYGGWGVKGSARDRLLGGRGVIALRVTYADDGNRTLTFLTSKAEIACNLINSRRS